MQLLYTAKKYLIENLQEKCKQFIERNIDIHNVCDILEQSIFFEEKDLTSKCMSIISSDPASVFASEGFGNLSSSTLAKVFDNEQLNSPEVKIFDAAISWAKLKCEEMFPTIEDQRKMLGEALYKIRFPTMSLEDFTGCLMKCKILTDEEELLCYRVIGSKLRSAALSSSPIPFKLNPRTRGNYTLMRDSKMTMVHSLRNIPNLTVGFYIKNDSEFPVMVHAFYFLSFEDMDFKLYQEVTQQQPTHPGPKGFNFSGGAVSGLQPVAVIQKSTETIKGVSHMFVKLAQPKICRLDHDVLRFQYSYIPKPVQFGAAAQKQPSQFSVPGIKGSDFHIESGDVKLHIAVTNLNPITTGNISFTGTVNNAFYSHLTGVVCRKN